MSGEILLDQESQLIRVAFGEESTVEDWKGALVQVKKISTDTGVRRVLIDVRKQTNLADPGQQFSFAANLPSSMAFAVLCEIHLDDHRFIENVAMNRSITVKDFDSEKNAIEWLEHWPNRS